MNHVVPLPHNLLHLHVSSSLLSLSETSDAFHRVSVCMRTCVCVCMPSVFLIMYQHSDAWHWYFILHSHYLLRSISQPQQPQTLCCSLLQSGDAAWCLPRSAPALLCFQAQLSTWPALIFLGRADTYLCGPPPIISIIHTAGGGRHVSVLPTSLSSVVTYWDLWADSPAQNL